MHVTAFASFLPKEAASSAGRRRRAERTRVDSRENGKLNPVEACPDEEVLGIPLRKTTPCLSILPLLSFLSLFLCSSRDRWGIELSALVDRAYLRRVNPRNFIGNAPHRANPRVPGLAIAREFRENRLTLVFLAFSLSLFLSVSLSDLSNMGTRELR